MPLQVRLPVNMRTEDWFDGLKRRSLNEQTSLKFVNTSMHGVSDSPMSKAFPLFGLPKYIPVEAQQQPDPEFPTVKFPNPEEKGLCIEIPRKTALIIYAFVLTGISRGSGEYTMLSLCMGERLTSCRTSPSQRQTRQAQTTFSHKIQTRIDSLPLRKGMFISTLFTFSHVLCSPDGKWIQFTGDQLGTLFASACLDKYRASGKPLGKRLTHSGGRCTQQSPQPSSRWSLRL